jgi:hypothetical protein
VFGIANDELARRDLALLCTLRSRSGPLPVETSEIVIFPCSPDLGRLPVQIKGFTAGLKAVETVGDAAARES